MNVVNNEQAAWPNLNGPVNEACKELCQKHNLYLSPNFPAFLSLACASLTDPPEIDEDLSALRLEGVREPNLILLPDEPIPWPEIHEQIEENLSPDQLKEVPLPEAQGLVANQIALALPRQYQNVPI